MDKLYEFYTKIGIFLFSCLALVSISCYATNRGVPDNGVHKFAGYLGIPNQSNAPALCPSGTVDTIYFSCGAYLVDVESIAPGLRLPQGRIVMTAGHCAAPHDNDLPYIIHFQDGDARQLSAAGKCTSPRTIGFKKGFNYYKGIKSWTPFIEQGTGLGIGTTKDDYTLILLDRAVSSTVVPKPTKVAFTTGDLTPADIPILGVAGYGIVIWGDPEKDGHGTPTPIDGPREKQYVELKTRSVQNHNISSIMNNSQGDQTLCGGDSGSALFLPQKDKNGYYITYGHVSDGDQQCRSTNTAARVDTLEFRDWVRSVADDIKREAARK